MLRNIGLNLHFLDENVIKKIIITMIASKLEYAEIIWFPYKEKHVLKLEKIQRIATKMVPDLKNLPYKIKINTQH